MLTWLESPDVAAKSLLDSKDLINGCWELGAAAFTGMNVRQALRDKMIRGVHWLPTIYFTCWGLWNIYYYPALNQWFSLGGGLAIMVMNFVWLALVIRYWNPKPKWLLQFIDFWKSEEAST